MNMKGKTVVIGITGGIAAYKMAQVCSDLIKKGVDVHVIMTKNATEFIAPLVFETLTNNRVSVDTFDRNFQWNVQHVSLAKKADVFLVAPATANILAKMAWGIADDMLSTTVLAARCPKLVSPAMNTGMYDNPATQRNMEMLKKDGVMIIEPDSGFLACRDVGKGRLPDPAVLETWLEYAMSPKDLAGKKILVSAGPTREPIDPVRFISNRSTGRMGYEMARAAWLRGAQVTLVSGPVELKDPLGVETIRVETAAQMYDAITSRAPEMDIIVKTAAVADYTPATVAADKIKKSGDNMAMEVVRTKDILKALGENKPEGQVLCGFSMETKDLLENSAKKLGGKNADMIIANDLNVEGAGFAVTTNVATIITKDGAEPLELMTKGELSDIVLSRALDLYNQKHNG